jgi:hypothetical protein
MPDICVTLPQFLTLCFSPTTTLLFRKSNIVNQQFECIRGEVDENWLEVQ